jgi:5-methylcytosine-specific restriction endonuclease McrA
VELTLDHLTPLVQEVKRKYADEELVTACRPCNSSRGGSLSRGGRGYGDTRP